MDALCSERYLCQAIVSRSRDYVVRVKGKQPAVLEQFLPQFNQRFRVPPHHPEPAFRPLNPELCLEQVRYFKHRREVSRDNTVRFHLHTLQLLSGPKRPSYAGAAVEVLKGLDGRRSARHGGRILAAQETPPSPVFLRNGLHRSAPVPVQTSGTHVLGERWTAALEPMDSRVENEKAQGDNTGSAAAAGKPKPASPRNPTFLQRERKMGGDSESQAQGDVAASDRAGVMIRLAQGIFPDMLGPCRQSPSNPAFHPS